ncbi:diguanylate cyclase [Caldimonas tepidiphila]|uniref:diguanylate cyclase n=1 Tax=Caldimonas tepidiphila TaxID=2315841 RepID=UPI000E5B4D48|nr:diguanylate cyclase [Caldimonas tepidiphila]
MSGLRSWALRLLALAWGALFLPAGALAALPALLLDDRTLRVEAWPSATVRSDPFGTLTLGEVLASPARFAVPDSAYATLGLRKDVVWLRVPLAVAPSSDGRWILDIDYPVLNRIDVHLVGPAGPVQHTVLGSLLPRAQRPLASRTHAVELALQPGTRYDLLLRVEHSGAHVLPITLNKPAAFHARSQQEQMLQGLLTGFGLCLLLYSLMQAVNLREPLFFRYALLISGSILFSAFQFGIGAQYLWSDNRWIEQHMAGLSALLAAGGTFLFVERALAGAPTWRHFGTAMRLGAAVLLVTGVAHAADWIDTHAVSAVVSSVGLLPALMGIPGSVRLLRRGDSVGAYLLLAWAGYFVATATMVGVVQGRIDVGFWTLHSFQLGATFDMLAFMRVVSLRSQAIHAAARHAVRERDVLHSLAHTDALTGLPNRRGLDAALAAALPGCTPGHLLALYMLDLDGFKQVNDTHGHEVGDELLLAVAQRLQAQLRASDVVARLGGDEFVVMAEGLPGERQAREIGTKLIEAFRMPFELAGGPVCRVGLTVGYVLVPLDGDDPAELLRRADAAMYAGKHGGKGSLRRGVAA